MNTNYFETLDENFMQAINLYEQSYSHDELLNLIKTGNIVQKQIAVLRINKIESSVDIEVLLENLTGQDGKVREAVSMKLAEFVCESKFLKYFTSKDYTTILLDALIDINGNICRNIIIIISKLKEDENFCQEFCTRLAHLTETLLETVEKIDFKKGKYKVNKEVFKLYWCLEAIYVLSDKFNNEILFSILSRAKNIGDYTIREKVAKILTTNLEKSYFAQIKSELKNDENYYVRRYFTGI